MSSFKNWILAARPKTLLASLSPVLLGSALAMEDGSFDAMIFLITLLTAAGIQIATNLVNDYFDFIRGADVSSRKGPTRVMQAQLVSAKAMKRAITIVFCITFFLGLYLVAKGGIFLLFLLCLSLLLAFLYTGGPYPLAYLGLGDIFVLIFFGPLAVGGTYFLQTQSWSLESLLIGLAPGALSTAILIANNLRDFEEDKRAKKRTLVVRFGITFGKWEYLFFILLAFSIPFFVAAYHPFALLASLGLFSAFKLIGKLFSCNDPLSFQAIFAKTPPLLFFFSLLFIIGWML